MATNEASIQEGAEQVVEGLEEIAVAAPAGINKGVLLVGGVIIGASLGYYFTKRHLAKKYMAQADSEIEAMREHYASKLRTSAAIRTADVDEATQIIEEQEYGPQPTTRSELKDLQQEQHVVNPEAWRKAAEDELAAEPEITANVFEVDDEWNWDFENDLRAGGVDPYVLHHEEWTTEGMYTRLSLTYFEGDDVLADEHDTPIDDQDAMVGLANLAKFGHGSGDPNVVYIRNVELELEIEIVHSDGKFSEERRGIVEPPTDPSDPRRRRNPPGDDQSDMRRRRNRGPH